MIIVRIFMNNLKYFSAGDFNYTSIKVNYYFLSCGLMILQA